ncbi:wax ester/triacylglycerol synthase domain-containing protein [Streptomyces orinoci]|uniref:diacylglycerol O-acyltransferase n=1 Tax=Streptomyces orinoci TaxID=67339 RepID=A0ABV3JUS7_STRON|nr:wax ester/triacylglycerol synthase domain-containing protein [Streptomyces orinoci]
MTTTPLLHPAPVAGVAAAADMPPLDAWLYRHQSSGAMCMTAGLLAWCTGTPPTLAELRELAGDRWKRHQRLTLTPVCDTAPDSWPRWAPVTGFDMAGQVLAEETGPALEARVAQLLAQPLGPGRPPWQLHLLPAADGFALLLRAHHALLDGKSLISLMCALFDGRPERPGLLRRPLPQGPSRRAALARALADALPRARPLPFHGPVDARRAVGWSRLTRDELGIARDSLASGRASANAVFLAATAGALRSAGLLGRLPLLPGVCAMVPVDVRTPGEAVALGNHYATVRVPLPVRRRPEQRLAALDRFTRRAALHRRARAQALLVSSRPHRTNALGEALGRYADSPLYSSLLCSSLASHLGPLTLGDAQLTGFSGLSPLSPGHPLALTMTLHDTAVTITAVSDHAHRALAARLPMLIGDEIRALRP